MRNESCAWTNSAIHWSNRQPEAGAKPSGAGKYPIVWAVHAATAIGVMASRAPSSSNAAIVSEVRVTASLSASSM